MSITRVGDLDITQDLEFQRRSWVVQRIGWVIMCVVLVAALLGLMGDGPLSRVSSASADGSLQLEYLRFDRHRAPSELQIRVAGSSVGERGVKLWIDRAYLHGVEVRTIFPEPDQVEIGTERVTYTFLVEQPRQPVQIGLEVSHGAIGPKQGQIGLSDGGAPLAINQLVYP